MTTEKAEAKGEKSKHNLYILTVIMISMYNIG